MDTSAVRDYDMAVRELRSLSSLLDRGHEELVRQKLGRVLSHAERALAGMDALTEEVRPSRYQSLYDGELSYEALAARLRQMREEARKQLDTLMPGATPEGGSTAAPQEGGTSPGGAL